MKLRISPSGFAKMLEKMRCAIDPLGAPSAPVFPELSPMHINVLSQIFDLGVIKETTARPALPSRGGFPAMPARIELVSDADSLTAPQVIIDDLAACGLVLPWGGITDTGLEFLNIKDLVAA